MPYRVALILTFLSFAGVLQAARWSEADSLLHLWHRERPNADARAHLNAGDSMRLASSDCRTQLFGANLLLRGWAMNPKMRPANWRESISLPAECEVSSARYHYQYAVMEYLDEAWPQAVHHFQSALKLTRDSLFRQECHTSLAACYNKLPERSDSVLWHLESALRWGPTSPYLLNNIAGVYLNDSQGERALPFIQRALQQRQLPENLVFNLTLNLLNAYQLTGQIDEAAGVYDSLKQMEITAGNRVVFVRSLAQYLLASDRYDEYRAMYNRFAALLGGDSLSSGAVQWLFQPGRSALGDTLASPITANQWATIRWASEHTSPSTALSKTEESGLEDHPGTPASFPILAAVLLGLVGFLAGRISTKKRVAPAENVDHPLIVELIHQIQHQADEHAIVANLHKLDALWRVKHEATYRTIQPTDEPLTMVEDQVLELIASGRTTKEIAQVLDLSVSYVYNVRTRLRKKLNVPDERQIEQWIHESKQ